MKSGLLYLSELKPAPPDVNIDKKATGKFR